MRRLSGTAFLVATLFAFSSCAFGGELTIPQVQAFGRIKDVLNSTLLSTPISPSSLNLPTTVQIVSPAARYGNFAYTYQRGNNDFVQTSQVGGANSSQIWQLGNHNTAIVSQTMR